MKSIRNSKNHTHLILTLCLAAVGAAGWQLTTKQTSSPTPAHDGPPNASTDGTSPPMAAHLTYRDPFTGKLGARPPAVAPLNLQNMQAFSTSNEGLVEVQSPVIPKTILLHLRGRFQHGMVVSRDSENGIQTVCATDLAASHQAGRTH